MSTLRFTVPVPSAKKNSRVLSRKLNGALSSRPNRKAERSAEQIAGAAIAKLVARQHDPEHQGPLIPDDDVAVRILYRVEQQRVEVEVTTAGPKPDENSGRERDIDNLATTILDALNGVAFTDDRQVAMLQVERD